MTLDPAYDQEQVPDANKMTLAFHAAGVVGQGTAEQPPPAAPVVTKNEGENR